MDWITLDKEEQLNGIVQKSFEKPQLIYKHSISCPISSMSKLRLEKSNAPDSIDFYYLDILTNRPISNRIATDFDVRHESPQILLIKDGKAVYNNSHHHINMDDIVAHVSDK